MSADPVTGGGAPTALLAAAVAQLAEGVIVTDVDGRITYVNDAAARLHGVARLDVPPADYASTYQLFTMHGDPFPSAELPLARAVLRGETVVDARWRIRRPDGSEVLAVGSARPVVGPDGRQAGAVLTLRDDTHREAAARAARERDALAGELRDAFAQSPVSTVIYDATGRPIAANPAFERLWGAGLADVPAGYNVFEDPQLAAAGVLPLLRRAFGLDGAQSADGAGEAVSMPALPYDIATASGTGRGRVLWTEAQAYPVRDARGAVERVVLTHADVTARREAEAALEEASAERDAQNEQLREQAMEMELSNRELQEQAALLRASESRYRSLAAAVPVQVWTARPDGQLDYVSERTVAYFGVPAAELLGSGWGAFVHPDDLAEVIATWTHALGTGTPYETEFRVRPSASDGYRWHLVRAVPERDANGVVIGWVGSNTDVEDERHARTEAEAAQQAAEEANRAKSEFLAVMSHELRTPLNAIGGYAQLLEMEVRGPVTAEQRADLARIQRSQRHLLGLINGVLNYARIDAGAVRYDVADVDLQDVVATCESLVAPQARAKAISFRTDGCADAPHARADQEKVQQVVLNLVGNAVKFTEPGGQVTVACGRVAGHGDASHEMACIVVTDTGIGIDADHAERIFEPFVQVDVRLTRTQEGTGLGLAISRDLARGMGGDILVASEPGVGSTFTLLLPLAERPVSPG